MRAAPVGSREQPDPAAKSAVLMSSTGAKKLGAVAEGGGLGLDSAPGPAPSRMLLRLHLLQAAEPRSMQGPLCAAQNSDQWAWACKPDTALFLRSSRRQPLVAWNWYVDHTGLELTTLLFLLPESWDHRCVSPCLTKCQGFTA